MLCRPVVPYAIIKCCALKVNTHLQKATVEAYVLHSHIKCVMLLRTIIQATCSTQAIKPEQLLKLYQNCSFRAFLINFLSLYQQKHHFTNVFAAVFNIRYTLLPNDGKILLKYVVVVSDLFACI